MAVSKKEFLLSVAWDQDAAQVQDLLLQGADVNAVDKDGKTPVMWAATAGSPEVMAVLLTFNGNVNAKANDLSTALHIAALGGHSEIVQMLLEKDALVHALDEDGVTPLMDAAKGGHVEIISLLVKAGGDINVQDREGRSALTWAVTRSSSIAAINYLLSLGAQVNAATPQSETSLMYAVRLGNKEIVQTLLAGGADVQIKNDDGDRALELARKSRREDIASLLG